MANPETIEFLSFRRTFTLLILLVVLPSAGLSGFGIVAIVNERAAVEKRLEAVWSGRLEGVSKDLSALLQTATVTGQEEVLSLELGGRPLTDHGFRLEEGRFISEDPALTAAVTVLASQLTSLPERPVFFTVASQRGPLVIAAMKRGATVYGAQVSQTRLNELVTEVGQRTTPPGELARFAVAPVQRAVPDGVLARFVSGVTEVREAALGIRELSSLVLPAPMHDLRLVAYAEGEDPVAKASTRNRILYGVLLAIFYATLALGTVYTARTLYREAKLSRLKTDFVSLVSHELRTPLTSIRMFIEMLATNRVRDEAEMKTVLELLSKETARLSAMIEGVLDWSRIESGKKSYERSRVEASEIVAIAVDALRAQRVGQPVVLELSVPESGLRLNVDKQALAGVVLNLLQNAFKYSAEPRAIAVRALVDDGTVVIEVEDNGIGISKRDQKRIFDRFFRVDSLMTRSTEGSGLGLSIAQRVVTAHGGRISVDSVVGKGSTFRVHLPLASP